MLYYPPGNMHIASLLQWAFERTVPKYCSHNTPGSPRQKEYIGPIILQPLTNCTSHTYILAMTPDFT
jgi:hypothetical protein